ncbi:MAG: YaeQ family protein [Rhodocyclaceae bacterium]|nr:YaeQ family protein [Rhodocyclaceae bacterium]
MAIKSTVFKAELQVSDLDRSHYGSYALTLARHPSETDERLMVRLLAFARHADEALSFGGGVSNDEEPALWRKDLTGAVELWVEVGTPDERRLKKACGRSPEVVLYVYGRSSDVWWREQGPALSKLANLSVYLISNESSQALAALARRNMSLTATLQEGQIWLSSDEANICVEPQLLAGPGVPA